MTRSRLTCFPISKTGLSPSIASLTIKGNHFYQKDVDPTQLPRFVKCVSLPAKSAGKTVHYVVCNNKDTLLYLANLGCIEMNPWSSRTGHPDKPDFMTLDLDLSRRDRVLDGLRVRNYCKTSGKTGLHVLVPLGGKYNFAQVRRFAKLLAERVAAEVPELATTQHRIGKRRGKVYRLHAQRGRSDRRRPLFVAALARRNGFDSPGVARSEKGSAPAAVYDQDNLSND